MRATRDVGYYVAAFMVATLVALACGHGTYPTTVFRCYPGDTGDRCPGDGSSYMCCSDDPAALDLADLDGPSLPAYAGVAASGVPLFSGARNDASHSGMCIKIGAISPGIVLNDPPGCPKPCNPSWEQDEIDVVCGEGKEALAARPSRSRSRTVCSTRSWVAGAAGGQRGGTTSSASVASRPPPGPSMRTGPIRIRAGAAVRPSSRG